MEATQTSGLSLARRLVNPENCMALYKGFCAAYKQPMRVVGAAATATTGLANLCQGNYGTGAFYAAAGTKELYNIFCGSNATSNLEKILSEAVASTETLKMFQEDNRLSLAKASEHLASIDSSLLEQKNTLNDLKALSESAGAEAKAYCKEMQQACEKSIADLLAARDIMQKIHEAGIKEQTTLSESFSQIEELQSQVSKMLDGVRSGEILDNEQITALLGVVKSVSDQVLNCQESVKETNANVEKVSGLLFTVYKQVQHMYSLQNKYTASLNLVIDQTNQKLQALEKENKKSQKEAKKAKIELEQIERLNKRLDAMMGELEEQLADAREAAKSTATYDEILVGGGVAAIAAVATISLSTVTAVGTVLTAPLLGTVLYKNRSSVASAVNTYLFRKESVEPKLATPTANNPVVAAFDSQSSGYWGHYVTGKKSSTTVGSVAVALPNGSTKTLRFDLNSKDKIPGLDLLGLIKELKQSVEQDPKNADACLKVIEGLRNCTLDRGKEGKCKGLIRSTEAFNYLEDLCIAKKKACKT